MAFAMICSVKINVNSYSDKQGIINNYKVMALGEDSEEQDNLNIYVQGKSNITTTMSFINIAYENNEENINNLKVNIGKYSGIPDKGYFSIGIYGSDELLTDHTQATAIYEAPTAADQCSRITDGLVEDISLNVDTENLNYKYLYVVVRVYGGSTFDGNFNYSVSNIQFKVNDNLNDSVIDVTERYGLSVEYETPEKEEPEPEETEKNLNVNIQGEKNTTMSFINMAYENNEENINNLKVNIGEYSGIPDKGYFSIGLYGSDELLTDHTQATAIYEVPTAADQCSRITDGLVKNITLNVDTENINYKYLYVVVRVYGGSTFDGNFNYSVSNIQFKVNDNLNDNLIDVTERYGLSVTYEINEKEEPEPDEDQKPTTKKTVYLIGHFGQSNAEGRGSNTRPSDMSDDAILVNVANSTITHGNSFADKTSSSPQFASHLAKLSGKTIAIVKSTKGGTAIGSPADPTWNANVEGSLADKAVSDYKQAVEILENSGYTVVQVGYVWTQGEADYTFNYYDSYEQNLTALVNKFRNDISPDFKVFINLAGDRNAYQDIEYGNLEMIRKAQINVSKNIDGVYVVSDIAPRFVSTDLNLIQDQWHYKDEGYIMLGTQSAEYTYKYLFKNDETSTTELENYKQEKIQFATNYTSLDSSSEVKALVDTAINKINLDTTQTKVMVDEIISDLDFSVGASLLKQNVISEINKYNSNNNSESLNNLISTTLLKVEDAVTVYEIESASFEALSKIKIESAKEATNNDSITNESTNNPNTYDNIIKYGILLLIGLIGVISTYKFIFKKKKTLENN